MQKCALCNFDYEMVSLQEGRCPQCGNIIEWPEEPEASDSQASVAGQQPVEKTADAPLSPEPVTEATIYSESVAPRSIAASPIAPNPIAPSPGAPSPSSFATELPKAEAASAALPKEMDQLWRDSIQGAADVRSTLKGPDSSPESHNTVSDSVFAILPREVRSPLNVSDKPVDYELLDVIGQGGVGVVYTARQASIDRTVAIKMLKEEYRKGNEHQEKFLAEAILTGELDHPNIVPIYDLGRNAQGELFYSMKNVIGTPWDRVIAQKDTRENIEILLKVADAVAFAHSRSVVHRDLKPENVMLGSFGEVLVMDWGIAVATEGFRRTSSILRSQAMGGTPAYMAPELATGPMETIGPAADVYLLGAILFEILTGFPPHYGNDVMECVQNAAKNIIRETEVTGELMEIAIRAMATLPRRRYRSVKSFQAAIRLYQSHSESLTLSESAEADLNEAISTRDYQGFSRAVFAFEEAFALWDQNTAAKLGLSRAKAAYAETAYEKGDYDLGLSLLDETEDDHRPLRQKLRTAIKERDARQNRFKTIRRVAVALTGFIVIAGSIGMIVILQLNAGLKSAYKDAREQKTKAQESAVTAREEREQAVKAQQFAEKARLESIQQRRQAEESSYFAEIGLVGASIQKNQFSIAAEILSQQELSDAKSRIRHWEWGRHQFLVRGGSSDDAVQIVTTYPTGDSVECIDRTVDGKWVAIGKLTGECELWRLSDKQPTAKFRHGRSLSDLDFNSDGTMIVSSGVDDDNSGTVCIWRLQEGKEPFLEKKLPMKSGPAMAVAFSNDPKSEYIAAGDNKGIGRIWKWQETREVASLNGHLGGFTSIEFSPSNEYVVSASSDRTARLWKIAGGLEMQQFSGHEAPVFSATFAPDGKTIASSGADGRVLVWTVSEQDTRAQQVEDVKNQLKGKPIAKQTFQALEGHSGTVQEVAYSLDGKRLVSTANDNEVYVWDVPSNSTTATTTPVHRLRGHGGWVRACRFSADGTQVLSGSDDRSWKIWRLDSYREKLVFNAESPPILDACYAPSGGMIATAHSDGTIALWNPNSGERTALLNDGHEYLTNKAKVSKDGSRLATAAGDNTLRLWDLQRGTQLALMAHAGRDGIFSISQSGRWLVAGGDKQGVAIWDLESLSPPVRIRAWPEPAAEKEKGPTVLPVTAVAISEDGQHVVVGDKSGTVEFWDVERGALITKVFGHTESVVACFFLPADASASADASQAAISVSSDGSVAWWDSTTGQKLPRERIQHFAAVQLAACSLNGKFLASCASLDGKKSRLWIWDLTTGEKVATKEIADVLIQDLAFATSDSPTVIVTTSDPVDSEKKIWRWDGRSEEWMATGHAGMTPKSLLGAVLTDNDSNLLTYGGRGARLWGMSDGKELMSFLPSPSILSLCFDSSGTYLASASDDGTALIWDVAKQASIQKLLGGHSGAIRDLVFSIDNQSVITSGKDGRIVLWNVASGTPTTFGLIQKPTVIGNSLRLTPDGKVLAVACDDNLIRLYDSTTLKQTNELRGHVAAVNCLAFSFDGRWLVSGSQDQTIRLWSNSTGLEIGKLLGHSAPLASVVFSSDGLRVLSASQDTTVRLWDIGRMKESRAGAQHQPGESNASLGEVLSLEYHSSETTVAEFSPDGRTILTAGVDGKAVLWPSERIPPAIRVSSPNLTYKIIDGQLPTGLMRIDANAVLCQPGTLDMDGAMIELSLESTDPSFCKLALDTSDGRFSIDGSTLLYHPANSQAVAIGALSAGAELRFNFSNLAKHAAVEELIRHVAIQDLGVLLKQPNLSCDVVVRIVDREGRSGNYHPERVRVNRIVENSDKESESDSEEISETNESA
ncbi:MAG: protein kinase [Pirellulaceae bacterium]|nr:protein kinase [Pirellulaceae bacterium]